MPFLESIFSFVVGTTPSGLALVVFAMPVMHALVYQLTAHVTLPFVLEHGLPFLHKSLLALSDKIGRHAPEQRFKLLREDELITCAAVALAFLLTYVTFFPSLFLTSSKGEGYNNESPRGQTCRKSGLGQRLYSAHQNAHEAFPGFAAAVCISLVLSSTVNSAKVGERAGPEVAGLAWVFIIYRLFHWLFYAINTPNLRTLAFMGGIQTTMLIFAKAVLGFTCLRD